VEFLAIGLVAGLLSGVFGIGGGIIIVPAMVLVARVTPHRATGTSLAALLLPVGALGAWQYWKRGDVDVRAAAFIALGILVGAWGGAYLGLSIPPRTLQRAFAVLLVAVAAQLWWKS